MDKVILVEDNDDLRLLLTEELELEALSVTAVECAIACYQALVIETFDVAILDVGLPDQSGLEIARYLRRKTELGIVMLTARSGEEERIAGYEAGADIYYVKPVSGRELALAVKNLSFRFRGRAGRRTAEEAVWVFDQSDWSLASPAGVKQPLSGKEKQFVEALMSEGGRVAKRSELLALLGYQEDEFGHHALNTLVLRLRKKYADENTTLPIKTVRGVGYQFCSRFLVAGA